MYMEWTASMYFLYHTPYVIFIYINYLQYNKIHF